MHSKIELSQDDITKLKVDSIVNAANKSLLGGGGVDGAIHRAAGRKLLDECRTLNGCDTGMAKITSAYKLPSYFIIHTVGPVWRGGTHKEEDLLRNCYIESLKLADKNDCKSVAFPNISTGIYGFPKDKASLIAFYAVKEYLLGESNIEKVIFVCFDNENYQLYENLLKQY
ncbi:O-acetyl-ADP-ribose deacetylase [Bacteroidota bacterium]